MTKQGFKSILVLLHIFI